MFLPSRPTCSNTLPLDVRKWQKSDNQNDRKVTTHKMKLNFTDKCSIKFVGEVLLHVHVHLWLTLFVILLHLWFCNICVNGVYICGVRTFVDITAFEGSTPPPPPNKICFLQISQILMVSDKAIHKAFRSHTTNKQSPLEICFYFHCSPKLHWI